MNIKRQNHIKSWKKQQGVTLIELLVAAMISLIAVSGMVIVMASTLGTSAQTVEMSRLSQEMRTAMQIMSRELRRANYHPSFLACYGNPGCLGTGPGGLNITNRIGQIQISTSVNAGDCFWFWYDRPQICPTASCTAAELAAAQTGVTTESVAAFRRAETGGVGRLQMTSTRTSNVACTATDLLGNWIDITDPNIIDVQTFTVTNGESIVETINGAGDTQRVEKIGLILTAKLTADPSVPGWIQSNANASRQLSEFVKVRNHVTTAFVAP